MLAALEIQLGRTSYALGNRPTAVDTILLGGLRAHTNADPLPDLSNYLKIQDWDHTNAGQWNGEGELAAFSESTPFAAHILKLAREQYAPFVLGNAAALASGQKAFVIDTYGEPASYLARPYPEQSRKMVQARIRDRLSDVERSEVLAWLDKEGLRKAFAP